jgi:hypothetical protein
MTMKTQPISRRALAAGLALAPVAGLPALAGAVSADDPVFAVLAERDRLEAIHLAAITRADELQTETAEAEQGAACSAVCDYERDVLLTTVPTTKAGALALLRFLGNYLQSFCGEEKSVANAVAAVADFIEGRA